MMRKMLANSEQFPSIGIFVLISFVMIFTVIVFKLWRYSKQEFSQNAQIPLKEEEVLTLKESESGR